MIYELIVHYLPEGETDPNEDYQMRMKVGSTDGSGVMVFPSVGDYVDIDDWAINGKSLKFDGKVVYRRFFYERKPDEIICLVIIVVQEIKGQSD